MTPLPWSVSHPHRNVHVIDVDMQRNRSWEQWVLLRSDAHHDNPQCRRELEREHLDLALSRGAPIIDIGDLFCAMQGRKDRRSSKSNLLEEDQRDDYFNSIVENAASFYGPYAQNWAVFGLGNHETAITKHNEINLTKMLVDKMRLLGSPCSMGGYRGWVPFVFRAGKKGKNQWSMPVILHYDHGHGGGGVVTHGKIGNQRRMAHVGKADIIISGHVHRQSMDRVCVEDLTDNSHRPKQREVTLLILPTYKDEFEDGHSGFQVERGQDPRPLGAWWLRFWWRKRQTGKYRKEEIRYDCIAAQ